MKYHFSRKHLGIPYAVFLACFVIVPLLVILFYAFTSGEGKPTISNLVAFFSSKNAIGTLFYSTLIAIATTLVCLCIAYPIAYILARSKMRKKTVLLVLFIVPMWINFTLRIVALKEVLTALEHNLAFHPFLNSIIGMTYDFMPFMILPLYTTLINLNNDFLEAAYDLGASKIEIFTKVTLPLTIPGIVSGVMMVFLPAMTNYVILDMLYNSTYNMGSLIGSYFNAYDWHSGSMISIILLLVIFIITWATNGFTEKDTDRKESL